MIAKATQRIELGPLGVLPTTRHARFALQQPPQPCAARAAVHGLRRRSSTWGPPKLVPLFNESRKLVPTSRRWGHRHHRARLRPGFFYRRAQRGVQKAMRPISRVPRLPTTECRAAGRVRRLAAWSQKTGYEAAKSKGSKCDRPGPRTGSSNMGSWIQCIGSPASVPRRHKPTPCRSFRRLDRLLPPAYRRRG